MFNSQCRWQKVLSPWRLKVPLTARRPGDKVEEEVEKEKGEEEEEEEDEEEEGKV